MIYLPNVLNQNPFIIDSVGTITENTTFIKAIVVNSTTGGSVVLRDINDKTIFSSPSGQHVAVSFPGGFATKGIKCSSITSGMTVYVYYE